MEQLIKYFGSKAALAKVLNVDRSAVTLWGIEGLPPKRAIQIERITSGVFKAVDIVGVKDETKE